MDQKGGCGASSMDRVKALISQLLTVYALLTQVRYTYSLVIKKDI